MINELEQRIAEQDRTIQYLREIKYSCLNKGKGVKKWRIGKIVQVVEK